MSTATLLRRILAILRYAYPDATEVEVRIDKGYIECRVDGVTVPRPPEEAYR